MAAETKYTANTFVAYVNSANSNMDGTGKMSIFLRGASNGTLVKTVTIKAQTNTTQGMVRLFVDDGTNRKLLSEIEIPAVTKSATDPSFETTINLNFFLKTDWTLYASTQKAETFNIIAEAQDWNYYTSVRPETTQYSAYNGATQISTANSNLDGTGTLGTVLISSGCNLRSITIKAMSNTTAGMIRLFLYNGYETRLFKEIPVTAVTRSSIAASFSHKIVFENSFALQSGWYLKASTEKNEYFNIIAESLEWSYPA